MSDTITLTATDGTRAALALRGAEPISWQVGGREYLWSGDPEHWNRQAPWLFPVVGASSGGVVRVEGREFPMAQHGFARDLRFRAVAHDDTSATLRLEDGPETRTHYPFAFRLDITARVRPAGLDLAVEIGNPGEVPLPYAVGFHPAFPWPFAGGTRAAGGGYAVVFEEPERPMVPEVGEGGLLARAERPVPLEGDTLALDPELFTEALVFRNARSRWLKFTGPGNGTIHVLVDDFPHLAIWTKPTAPFLSLECWTGHADWVGFAGELSERDSQRSLPPGAVARHGVRLSVEG
ncbi:aldose 1-epimerase family protein [Methylobacterium nigriterrae]|uniref:aldose 1-epimerase family protein n=1 Tax=Methylobacterium nigriterrae TaxID=3127512 RepID=UPI0030137008